MKSCHNLTRCSVARRKPIVSSSAAILITNSSATNQVACTGQWAMTSKHERTGHDQDVFNFMCTHDLLFTINTIFKPKKKMWGGRVWRCNVTYLPKHTDRRPTKLDYFLVSNRWKSAVQDSQVKWGASMHRFGLVQIRWSWRLRATTQTRTQVRLRRHATSGLEALWWSSQAKTA